MQEKNGTGFFQPRSYSLDDKGIGSYCYILGLFLMLVIADGE